MTAPMNEKRILMVDDSARDTEMAMDALRQDPSIKEIVSMRDGVEALDYLFCRAQFTGRADGHPSVILLDLKMPRVDGLEVLRQIKADKALRSIPVVMMTSSREEQDLVNSYKFGANAYVVKPVRFHDYMSAVKTVGAFWTSLNEPPPLKDSA